MTKGSNITKNGKISNKIYDALSAIAIVILLSFCLPRINLGPQFIDGYYHLLTAQGFIKSGGWVGIDWWSIAPSLRPHLYPPFYHIVLAVIEMVGMSGLSALTLTEVMISPLFFIAIFSIFRKRISPEFSCYFLLLSMSFFAFYVSIAGHVPASLAMIFGVLSWYLLKSKKIYSAILFLSLCFYTHAAMSYIFFLSFLFVGISKKEFRQHCFITCACAFLIGAPFILHFLINIKHISIVMLEQGRFFQLSIAICGLSIAALIAGCKNKKNEDWLFFTGYTISSFLIFIKYPYRMFSTQGMLGAIWLASYLLAFYKPAFLRRYKWSVLLFCLLIFFTHPTLNFSKNKIDISFINSAYFNFASGRWQDDVNSKPLYYKSMFEPLEETIKSNTNEFDVITGDSEFVVQMLAAVTNRLGAITAFKEVDRHLLNPILAAKIIIWEKTNISVLNEIKGKYELKKQFEGETHIVFLNPKYKSEVRPQKAKITFKHIGLLAMICLMVFCADVFKNKNSKLV